MDCLNQVNLRKLKEAISLSVYKINILIILIDKIVSLRRNFSKTLVILFFIIVFAIIFIKSIYQRCIPYWSFSKRAFLHLYHINIWKFDISIVNMKQMVWEPMKCLKIFLIYVTWAKQQHTFRRKTNCLYIHSSIQRKKVEKD